MTLSVRQTVTGFITAGSGTAAADFTDTGSGGIGVAQAGSLILFIVGGDKDSGTFTAPSQTPNVPVNLRTADVSLIMAWGTAVGGESVISGSIVTNVGGGQVTLVELVDSVNTGLWSVAASATHNSDGSTVTVWSSGTTGAASADALAVAAVAADSVNTAGTPTWSNSYTANRVTPSGGGQAGLWGSYKLVSSAATAESTLTRTGGTADQHSGAILAFTRAPLIITGVAAGTTSKPTGALTATETFPGVVAGTSVAARGALTATETLPGVVAGTTVAARGALTATETLAGVLAGAAPKAAGALTGTNTPPVVTGVLAGVAPRAVGSLAGTQTLSGVLAGVAPRAVGTLTDHVPTRRPVTIGLGVSASSGPAAGTPAAGGGPRAGGAVLVSTGPRAGGATAG